MININDKKDNKSINEFFIKSNNISYKFIIKKELSKIIIKCNDAHLIKLSLEEVIKKTKIYFESIEESYCFILNLFHMNKVIVKESLNEKEIIISFQTFNNISNKEEEIRLCLTNENTEKKINDIYYKYNLLKSDLSKLKEENTKNNKLIQLLFNEINNIKKENIINYDIETLKDIFEKSDRKFKNIEKKFLSPQNKRKLNFFALFNFNQTDQDLIKKYNSLIKKGYKL
jgi:hypothetical protein